MNEEQLTNLYREVIEEEIDFDQIKRDKNAFLREHFAEAEPVAAIHAGFMAPALSLCMIAFLFFTAVPQVRQETSGRETLSQATPAQREAPVEVVFYEKESVENLPTEKEPGQKENHVEVTRLTSQVGSTMFYQRTLNEVPVTIVWVFPHAIP